MSRVLSCPSCATRMKVVHIDSHYGKQDLVVDQCPNCGNIWFDEMDLIRTKNGEASRIDEPFNEEVYKNSPHSSHQNLRCPVDKSPLKPLHGLLIAQDLAMETCHTCDGTLLNQGEFNAYQKARFQSMRNVSAQKYKEKGIDINDETSVQVFNLLNYYKGIEEQSQLNLSVNQQGSISSSIFDIIFTLVRAYLRNRSR